MPKENHILLAYGFNGNGAASPLNKEEISIELKNDDNLAWVHLDADNNKTRSWLKKEVFYLDQIIIEALLAEQTRPRLVKFDNGSLIILRDVNLNKGDSPEDMTSIRMWIDSKRIISLQKRDSAAIKYIDDEIKNGRAPKNSGEFLTTFCGALSNNLEPIIETLDESIVDIEVKILEHHNSALREDIIITRKQAIMLKRFLAPQKDVINNLRLCNQDWLNDFDRRLLQENYDHITRYVEDLDEVRERSQIIHDELSNSITEKLNKNMYVLSVIASIFLPLTFVTGLFGMNLSPIPFADLHETGFYMVCLTLCLIVGFQTIYFKYKKWF